MCVGRIRGGFWGRTCVTVHDVVTSVFLWWHGEEIIHVRPYSILLSTPITMSTFNVPQKESLGATIGQLTYAYTWIY